MLKALICILWQLKCISIRPALGQLPFAMDAMNFGRIFLRVETGYPGLIDVDQFLRHRAVERDEIEPLLPVFRQLIPVMAEIFLSDQ